MLSAGGESGSDGRWQRLALLEAAFAGQGALFLLVFPLLVLLLLFLHLEERDGSEEDERLAAPLCSSLDATCSHLSCGHSPAWLPAGGAPMRGCHRRRACAALGAPRMGCSGARSEGRYKASGGWRRPSAGTLARLQRDECGRGVARARGWPLPGPSWGVSQGRCPYPGPCRCGAV